MAVDAVASRTDRADRRAAGVGPARRARAGEFRRTPVRSIGRLTPYYLPDEYIYPSLARSFAEHGRPMIRGAGVHFPALLDPLLTAPVWLVTNDPVTAFRLTQVEHAVFFSLAAIPAYFVARRLGLSCWWGVGVAALAVALPDGVLDAVLEALSLRE